MEQNLCSIPIPIIECHNHTGTKEITIFTDGKVTCH